MALLRRDHPTPTRHRAALTAAAYRVPLTNREQVQRLRKARDDGAWQAEAWDYFDRIGEVKQSVTLMGNLLGKLRLFAGVRQEPDEPPVPIGDSDLSRYATLAEEALARLRGPFGGHSVILAETNMNFDVAGECYLVGRAERPDRPEEWDIKSIDEVKVDADGKVTVEWDDTGKAEPLDEAAGDSIVRMWIRHPRRSWRADSPLHGVLDDCELILVYKAAKRAEGLSRAHNGIFMLDEDLDPAGPPDPTQDQGDGEAATSPLLQDFLEYVSTAIRDPGSAAAVAPFFLIGKGEKLANCGWEPMTREFSAVLEDRLRASLESAARGLNLPIEVVLGFRETTFANAFQVDQDEFDNFLEPRATLIVDAVTLGYHRPELVRLGVPAEAADRIEVWFDPSALISNPAEWDKAVAAHSAEAMSNSALLRIGGFSEADAPTPEELIARRGLSATTTELLALAMLRYTDPDLRLPEDLLEVRREEQQQESGAVAAITAGAPITSDRPGRRLVDIDRALRARLEVAADAALSRALERAGARLRSRAGQTQVAAAIDRVANSDVAATLGPALVAQIGFAEPTDLVGDAFDGLRERFDTWTAQAQADALGVVEQTIGALDGSERERLEREQAEDRDEAWTWLAVALAALAAARLFDPSPSVAPVGELDDTVSVPPGLIREAVARAGGAEGLEVTSGVAMIQGGTQPAGGVATGQRLMRYLGGRVTGWEWDYGPAPRTRVFEPHLALDGTRFSSFDDPALALAGGWPGPLARPGDHAGCRCDAVPITVAEPVERAA